MYQGVILLSAQESPDDGQLPRHRPLFLVIYSGIAETIVHASACRLIELQELISLSNRSSNIIRRADLEITSFHSSPKYSS